ncbi:MAG TPA: hypothetical protein VK087_07150 [Tissierellaceae bacterium]|nr:hypothetical protein [Tissierellaceae bacterium]
MKIDMLSKKGYVVHSYDNGRYALCRILKEYDNLEETKKDLVSVLVGNKTEEEIMED